MDTKEMHSTAYRALVQAIIANMTQEQKSAIKDTLDKMATERPAHFEHDDFMVKSFKYAHHVLYFAGK